MKTPLELLDYPLPAEAVAQEPPRRRDDAKLLVLNRKNGAITHTFFKHVTEFFRPGDVVVFNNSRVIPARLFARKETGAKVEVFLLQALDKKRRLWKALIAPAKRVKQTKKLWLSGGGEITIQNHENGIFNVSFEKIGDVSAYLRRFGHVPLPPYIRRKDTPRDRRRYQTVFARKDGSVAAPTAGLHWSQNLLRRLRSRNVETAFVTLHVGLGTFQPVTAKYLENHRMHSEMVEISKEAADKITAAKKRAGRVVAVGTTVVRTLEHVGRIFGAIQPYRGETNLFITPGFSFRVVDMLFTNFHQPRSTLLALACAFAGREKLLAAYLEALKNGYRFLSYGDAMLIGDFS